MKTIFTLIFSLFLVTTQSQELKTTTLLPPESIEHNDLSFLKEELKGKQLVMLGEQTHMYGNIFEMKARLVEYLHKELGFTTLAMESSMYDIWKMNKTGFNPKDFNNAIWEVWSSTLEFQRLVNYINDNNIKVIGFDSQVNNALQFIEDFFDYCDSHNIAIRLDKDDFGIIIEGVLENVKVDEDDIKYMVYEEELYRIIKEIEKLESNETNYYWEQFAKNLLASSKDAYYNKEEIYTTDLGTKNDNIRDRQMANNLLSYLHRNQNEKVICWADNIHVINDNSSIKKPIAKDFIPMGSYIKKELKNKSYSLATIHANDSLLDLGTKKWHPTPIEKNSFEYELNNISESYLYITSNQEGMKEAKTTRLLNFVDYTEARLDQLYDGYIFFQNATLPKRETTTDTFISPNKQAFIDKKMENSDTDQDVTLKGQILDKESHKPIPFATMVLKEEEIYRVADENGFYEFSVKKAPIQNRVVTISSMGFETQKISLVDLKNKVYLKPKFEDLPEIIITGYLSPKSVLKKAISNKKLNHPTKPFNFNRYGKILANKNDSEKLDLELITKDYDQGYLSPYVITQRVEQIKWNKNKNPEAYKFSSQFFSFRQNAIRFANILHKRKYKKFKLNFIKSDNVDDEDLYIIAFQTERNKWNYTNRGYPTEYSGNIYINKDNFAIVKVVENWETSLNKKEIDSYFKGYEAYKNNINVTIKEENICYYSDVLGDGKFYATRYFNRSYEEFTSTENKKTNSTLELDSYLYDFETDNVEEIDFEYRNKEKTVLDHVEYDKAFWDSFYERELNGNIE